MSQGRALVTMITSDDIRTQYVPIKSTTPFIVDLESLPLEFFENGEKITVTVVDNGLRKVFHQICKDGRVEGEGTIAEETPYHSVDYKPEYSAVLCRTSEMEKFRRIQERINIKERNNLAGRIRQALNAEDAENPEVLTFLLEMNSKLDEILSILRPALNLDGQFSVRGVSIGGGGITFFSERDLRGVDGIFITGTLEDSAKRITFACTGRHYEKKINPDGSGIYFLPFDSIEEEMRDEIVRFVFALERGMLKAVKK